MIVTKQRFNVFVYAVISSRSPKSYDTRIEAKANINLLTYDAVRTFDGKRFLMVKKTAKGNGKASKGIIIINTRKDNIEMKDTLKIVSLYFLINCDSRGLTQSQTVNTLVLLLLLFFVAVQTA